MGVTGHSAGGVHRLCATEHGDRPRPSDESLSGYTTFFTVTVDGREELERQAAVGESVAIRANVTGGYRMTLSVIGARPDGCSGDLVAVWAEPTLVPGT